MSKRRLPRVDRIAHATWLAACAVLLSLCGTHAAHGQVNLVQNPSFERSDDDGVPSGWDYYVLSNESAAAQRSETASDGRHSVSLSNARPYERDPANNWSQTITGDFSGLRLGVHARVKSSEVGEATVWLQCFRASPVQLLAAVSTSYELSIVGTTDWTEVRSEIVVPPATDFLVIRCVLRGTGRAWFDDISVQPLHAPAAQAKPVERRPDQRLALDNETAAQMIESAVLMQEALNQLRTSNEQLDDQIGFLQEEIGLLRDELRAREEAYPGFIPDSDVSATSSGIDPSQKSSVLAPGQHILIPRSGQGEG